MGPFGLFVTTPPAVEPVTLGEAKARLRITTTDEDTDLGTLISQAREMCEAQCQRAFVTQTLTLLIDRFPYVGVSTYAPWREGRTLYLPRPPLQSVTSVKYYDLSGVLTTVDPATYYVATGGEPGRLAPLWQQIWPFSQYGRPEAVQILYVAGYGLAAAVPTAAKAAILVTMAALRDDPTGSVGVPPAARRLLDTLEYGQVR